MRNKKALHTRIAPTPSGYLHAGNLYNFTRVQQLAEQHSAAILLRIDDLDAPRVRDEYIQNIFDQLAAHNITYDLGPRSIEELKTNWSQSLRLPQYNKLLAELIRKNLLYTCSCSRTNMHTCKCANDNLSTDTPDTALRLRPVNNRSITFTDTDSKTQTHPFPPEMQRVVIRRRDGLPSYQIASLSDDIEFGINLIVRGMDLLPSTLVQLYLAEMLGFEAFTTVRFLHHDLITDARGAKLSKSGL